ncbi:hypothetical protein EDD15DRAFT_1772316 [Pisolithus albus]|nr:hypothetical protein EDD15DRAFT_1772316 [Pisolithus albus]
MSGVTKLASPARNYGETWPLRRIDWALLRQKCPVSVHSIMLSSYRPGVAPLQVLCYAAISDRSFHESSVEDARQRLLIAAWTSLWPMRDEKHFSRSTPFPGS